MNQAIINFFRILFGIGCDHDACWMIGGRCAHCWRKGIPLLLLLSVLPLPAQLSPPPGSPQRVIITTDIGFDIDDAMAISVALRDSIYGRYINILAITVDFNGGGGNSLKRASLVQNMLIYGRLTGSVTVGAVQSTPGGTCASAGDNYANAANVALAANCPTCGYTNADNSTYGDYLTVIKAALAASPADSVDIVMLGGFIQVDALMHDAAYLSTYEPKIHHLIPMGGNFPSGSSEYNFHCLDSATAYVFAHNRDGGRTIPIHSVGAEVGGSSCMGIGAVAAVTPPAGSPGYQALVPVSAGELKCSDGSGPDKGRQAWDPSAMLYSIIGTASNGSFSHFSLSAEGCVATGSIPSTSWSSGGGCGHYYVIRSATPTQLQNTLNTEFYADFGGRAALGTTYAPIQIFEVDNASQSGRVHTLGMVFKKGDIATCAVPVVSSTPLDINSYQCDVKTRWEDGSLQRAVISFVYSLTASQTVSVSFQTGACNNVAYLTQAQMVAFNSSNWGAQIIVTAGGTGGGVGEVKTIDAPTMLNALSIAANQIEYDLQGPVVTKVRVHDATGAFAYDFGWHWNGTAMLDNTGAPFLTTSQYASLHPIFDLTFIPSKSIVQVEFILENQWTERAQDQVYDLVLKTGGTPAQVYSKSGITHLSRTNWHKTFWSGTTPSQVRYDWNLPYLSSTKLFPNYDTTISSQVSTAYVLTGSSTDIGNADWSAFTAGDRGELFGSVGMEKDFAANAEGALEQFTPLRYLHTMSGCGTVNGHCRRAWTILTGEFDAHASTTLCGGATCGVSGGGGYWGVIGGIPYHSRESRTGQKFYCPSYASKDATTGTSCDGTVDTRGKTLSRHAYKTTRIGGSNFPVTPVGTTTYGGWSLEASCSHWLSFAYIPAVLLGSRYYLDQLYDGATYCLSVANTDPYGANNGHFAPMEVFSIGLRGFAWGVHEVGKAGIAAPDGSPEKSYFLSIAKGNIEMQEGGMNITGTALTPSRRTACGSLSLADTNRWELGRCLYGQGITPALHATNSGQCRVDGAGDGPTYVDATKATDGYEPWFDLYTDIALWDLSDKGIAEAAPVATEISKRIIEITQDPASNPYLVSAYIGPIKGVGVACPGNGEISSNAYFSTWAAWKDAFTSALQAVSSFSAAGGVVGFQCADHGYSLLARAAATFGKQHGVSSGAYTATTTYAWLSDTSRIGYFSDGCPSYGDTQLKFALSPRAAGAGGPLSVKAGVPYPGLN